jgi:enoyl-CoA hydratase/carnithine racemase
VSDTILVERADGVATITLNRPDKLNALTAEMQQSYVDALTELDRDTDVRVIVVTGAGRGFCSGADLGDLVDIGDVLTQRPDASKLPTAALEIRKPIVAAVNGPVAGIGFALMLTTDVRFMAANARVSTTFARLGLVAEYGLSWLLPRVVGAGRAIELLMSGRIIDSDEALRIGLVHEVVRDGPVLDRALEWAHDVAAKCSPRSTATIKRQVYDDLDRSRGEAFDRSLDLMISSFEWGDLTEALQARGEGRDPHYRGLDA